MWSCKRFFGSGTGARERQVQVVFFMATEQKKRDEQTEILLPCESRLVVSAWSVKCDARDELRRNDIKTIQ